MDKNLIESLKSRYLIYRSLDSKDQTDSLHLEILNQFKSLLGKLELNGDMDSSLRLKNWLANLNIYDLNSSINELEKNQ